MLPPKKTKVKRPVGRPRHEDENFTPLQRELRSKVLTHTNRHFPAVMRQWLYLAGVGEEDKSIEVKIEGTDEAFSKPKKENLISPTVQNSACTSFIKLHVDTLKAVYGTEKGMAIAEEEQVQQTDNVRKFSLVVQNKDE